MSGTGRVDCDDVIMGRRSGKRERRVIHSAPEAESAPVAKRPKPAGPPDSSFLAQWLWKREAKSDEERFKQPYEYPLEDGGTLVVQQRPFSSEVRDSDVPRRRPVLTPCRL